MQITPIPCLTDNYAYIINDNLSKNGVYSLLALIILSEGKDITLGDLWEKVQRIAQKIYGADDIIANKKIREQFAQIEKNGFGNYPVCIAKTQYSFSTDPNLYGAPKGHVVPIREVRLAAGAEFVVVVCGAIMTMPGLPRKSAAENISLNSEGQIEGLF